MSQLWWVGDNPKEMSEEIPLTAVGGAVGVEDEVLATLGGEGAVQVLSTKSCVDFRNNGSVADLLRAERDGAVQVPCRDVQLTTTTVHLGSSATASATATAATEAAPVGIRVDRIVGVHSGVHDGTVFVVVVQHESEAAHHMPLTVHVVFRNGLADRSGTGGGGGGSGGDGTGDGEAGVVTTVAATWNDWAQRVQVRWWV